jgi:hypothetical protein
MSNNMQDIDLDLFKSKEPLNPSGLIGRMEPEELGDYKMAQFFHNMPIFIEEYYGEVNLLKFQREFLEWVVFSISHSYQSADKDAAPRSVPQKMLVRLCDWAFVKATKQNLVVYAKTKKLALQHLKALVSEFASLEACDPVPSFNLVSTESLDSHCTTEVKLLGEKAMTPEDMVYKNGLQ